MDVDEELERIPHKVSVEFYKNYARSQECCKLSINVPYELYQEVELDEIIKKCKVTIITFYSPTCPYCRAFEPIFRSVSRKFEGKAAFLRINVYRFPNIPRNLGIFSVPTTLFIVNEKIMRVVPGVIREEELEDLVTESLEIAECPTNILN